MAYTLPMPVLEQPASILVHFESREPAAMLKLLDRLAHAPRRKTLAALALLVLLATATAAWQLLRPQEATPHFVAVGRNAYILPSPDALAEFQLVRHDDAPFNIDSLKGCWSFLIFGYTFCPDFCPTTLVVFNEMHGLLARRAQGVSDVQFAMVSVDPARDTTNLLREYVPQFNREFIGVTGDAAQIARLAESVGAVYAKAPGSSAANYLVDHSTAVLLINPRGKLQGVFAVPHIAADMVRAFEKIVERAGSHSRAEQPAAPSTLSLAAR